MSPKTYDESFWNQRYAGDRFVYGTEPSAFLAEHSGLLTGPVLSLSEGEGRNAVYLASLGLDVLGVDISSVGLGKARQLAESRGVKIRTEVADLATYEPGEARFGAVISIFAHLPGALCSMRRRCCVADPRRCGIGCCSPRWAAPPQYPCSSLYCLHGSWLSARPQS